MIAIFQQTVNSVVLPVVATQPGPVTVTVELFEDSTQTCSVWSEEIDGNICHNLITFPFEHSCSDSTHFRGESGQYYFVVTLLNVIAKSWVNLYMNPDG